MPVVALTWWEVAAAAGAFVTTQVARWQKVTQAQKSQEKKKKKESQIKFRISANQSLTMAQLLFCG